MASRIIALVALFLLADISLFAQPGAGETQSDANTVASQRIVVNLQARVRPAEPKGSILDLPILEQLSQQKNLTELKVEGDVFSSGTVTTSFAFNSMEAYRTWYASRQVTTLLAELRTLSPTLQMSLSLLQR